MSLQHYVINPNTGRKCKVGGAIYRKLIRENSVAPCEDDPHVVCDYDSDDIEGTKERMQEYSRDLPPNKGLAKGRGAYKGKVVLKSKQPSYSDLVSTNIKATKKALKKCKKVTSEEEQTELEQLIMNELLKLKPVDSSRTKAKKVVKGKASKFAVKKQESSSESESESDESA